MARPYVLINVAATADGKIDTVERRGAAISSEGDRARVDQLRAAADAVMVGGRTLHAEDPRLTVRSDVLRAERRAQGRPEQPAKVGITSRFQLPPESRFLTAGGGRVIVLVPSGSVDGSPSGVEVYECGQGRVDLVHAMALLTDLGIERVLVEGGGTLNFELLRLGLVDELQLYLAPLVFGGASAPTLADGAGLARDAAILLHAPEVKIGQDGGVLLTYMVKRRVLSPG
jgi:2,5-diamino-6-(ribosylamino)-4(3H)-pyrimidinone 5'-phosphate reductase